MRKTFIRNIKIKFYKAYINRQLVIKTLVKLLSGMSLDKFFNHIDTHNFNQLFKNFVDDLYYLQTLPLYGNLNEHSLAFTLATGDTVYIFPYTEGVVENILLNPKEDILLKINNIKISPQAKITLKYKDRISVERISIATKIPYVFVELVIKLPIIFEDRFIGDIQ